MHAMREHKTIVYPGNLLSEQSLMPTRRVTLRAALSPPPGGKEKGLLSVT